MKKAADDLRCVNFRDIIQRTTSVLFPVTEAGPKPIGRRCKFLLFVIVCARLSAVSQSQNDSFENLAARASSAREGQDTMSALDLYGQAVRLRPDWAEGWWYLGLLRYGANDSSLATDAFNQYLQLAPQAAPAFALRGLCEFASGAYDNSLRDIEHGLALGAANQSRNEQILRYHLAQLLTRAGRFEDALKAYQFFADRNISDPDMLVGLGLAGMNVQSLSKDVPLDRRDLYRTAGEAGFAFMSGNSEGADRKFDQMFARYPTTANLHLFYGYLLFSHDPDLALDQFRKELSAAPANTPARGILAFTLMLQGRYLEAVPEATRTLAESPGMVIAQLALGRSLAQTGQFARGTELLDQVLRGDPKNLEAHIALASIYSRAGRTEDAYRERMVCLDLAK